MRKFTDIIDQTKDRAIILKVIADALIADIDNKISTKQYYYIKGYADCKIKQLNG